MGTPAHSWGEGRHPVTNTSENCLQFLKKLSMYPPCDPAAVFLRTHMRKQKAYVHVKARVSMFIVALLLTTITWKQPKRPPTDELTNEAEDRCSLGDDRH